MAGLCSSSQLIQKHIYCILFCFTNRTARQLVFICSANLWRTPYSALVINVIFLIPGWKYSHHFIACLQADKCITENEGRASIYKYIYIFFFISLGPFVIAKKMKNVISWGSWEVITIPLEVNWGRKEGGGLVFPTFSISYRWSDFGIAVKAEEIAFRI